MEVTQNFCLHTIGPMSHLFVPSCQKVVKYTFSLGSNACKIKIEILKFLKLPKNGGVANGERMGINSIISNNSFSLFSQFSICGVFVSQRELTEASKHHLLECTHSLKVAHSTTYSSFASPGTFLLSTNNNQMVLRNLSSFSISYMVYYALP